MKSRHLVTVLSVVLLACSALAPALHAFYNPQPGRWLNRDPINEVWHKSVTYSGKTHPEQEINHYLFIYNAPIATIDARGELPCTPDDWADCALGCLERSGTYFVGVKSCSRTYCFFFWRIKCTCTHKCELRDSIPFAGKLICLYNCPATNPNNDPANYIPIVVPAVEGCPETITDDGITIKR